MPLIIHGHHLPAFAIPLLLRLAIFDTKVKG